MSEPSTPAASSGAPVVLAFDTTGSACSVAVGRGEAVLAYERLEMQHGHAEVLLPMIGRVMQAARLLPVDIVIVAATVGPGGFTGIRAGLAAAHGLALAAKARLVGISSFSAVAAQIAGNSAPLLVALDSRRADFYVQLFDRYGGRCGEPAAILPEDLAAWVEDRSLIVAGNAAEAAAATLREHVPIGVLPDSAPDARGVLAALHRWPERTDPSAHPLYLRPPDVSLPKSGRGSL